MTRKLLFTAAAMVLSATLAVPMAEAIPLGPCPSSTTLFALIGNSCTIGDKEYDGFTYAGAIDPLLVEVDFSFVGSTYFISFTPIGNAAWTTATDIGWTVSVTDPNLRIKVVQDQMKSGASPSSDTVLFGANGDTELATNLVAGSQTVQFDNLFVTTLINTASYDPNSVTPCPAGTSGTTCFKGLFSVESTIEQTLVPEPGSMMLLGTGLFGLASVARRRSRNNRGFLKA